MSDISYAIVAIPSEDDFIWRISSEKIPHLTLLHLGGRLDNVNSVLGYMNHVVDTTLRRFVLHVERRGVLGEKEADVLFFRNYGVKRLDEIRRYFLDNVDVLKAYNSTEQFPNWVPHLTLGYPDSPAKPDTRDYPGTYSIDFNRIALWTGQYEGVEFPLKDDMDLVDLSMSAARGKNFLEHYGIKGMKWGVHRFSKEARAERKAARPGAGKKPSSDATTAVSLSFQGRNSGRQSLSNQDLQKLVTRWNLEQQYDRLRPRSKAESVAKWIGDAVITIGKDQAKNYARDQVGDAIKKSKA